VELKGYVHIVLKEPGPGLGPSLSLEPLEKESVGSAHALDLQRAGSRVEFPGADDPRRNVAEVQGVGPFGR
jgi:hypothetical protein